MASCSCTLAFCCFICGITICLKVGVKAAPSGRTTIQQALGWDDQCATSEHVMELCQKCAIKTKSNIVYPMCCQAKEAVREWCVSFVAYGLHDPGYDTR